MQNSFIKAMNFRHACKVFDETKKISDEDIQYILEAGRKSPSSFGMEGWKFLVISNEALKKKIRPVCWNQIQITSCSHLIIVLAAIENLKPSSGIPTKRFNRRPYSQEKIDAYIDLYSKHLSHVFSTDEHIYEWSARQTYIALANMMTASAYIGIDSCPIEGFEKEALENILRLDTNKWQVSVLLPLGYRLDKQTEQKRLAFNDVVEFIR
jgi:nitroreductase